MSLHSRSPSPSLLSGSRKAILGRTLGVAVALAGTLHAATAPAPRPSPQGDEVRFAWAGEIRQVFSRTIDTGSQIEHHTWTVGDGCVIRHRVTVDGQASGDWEIQDVPADASQSLLDIYFLEDGEIGWACGTAGLFLSTTDGGTTWAADRICTDSCWNQSSVNAYPTLWRVRFVSEDEGYMCGLWTFLRTTDGGATWDDVTLVGNAGPEFIEFYALEVVKVDGEWVGVCAGQEWAWSGHCPPAEWSAGPPPNPEELGGLVFQTDSRTGDGSTWTQVFSEFEYNALIPMPDPLLNLNDPWDVDFEPNADDLDEVVGYLCGGSGTTCGTILRTEDGGLSWSYEWGGGDCPNLNPALNDPYTLYSIAAMPDGRAIAGGYGGHVLYRRNNPTTGLIQWKKGWIDEVSGQPPGVFNGPLAGAAQELRDLPEEGTCLLVGSSGVIASTTVPPITSSTALAWEYENEDVNGVEFGCQGKETSYRFNDIYFRDDELNGLAVGQHQGIAESTDGGLTWNSLYGGPGSAQNSHPNLEGIAFKPNGLTGVAVGSGETNGYIYKLTFNSGTGSWDDPSSTKVTFPDSDWRLLGVDYAEFNHFWACGWELQGSTVRPLIVRSTNNGTNWTAFDLTTTDPDTLPDGPLPDDLILVDIAMHSARHGFVVGYIPGANDTDDPDTGMIYKIAYDDTLAAYTFSDVTPYGILPTDCRFHDVAVRGPNPQNGETYVAGGPNLLLVWDDGQGAFEEVSGIPGCPESCESTPNSTTCSLDFRSVSMAPEGDLILVGLEGVPHEHVSHELGRMLRNTGSSWEWIPGRSIKDCLATYVTSDDRAWVIVGPDNRGSIVSMTELGVWSRLDVDAEWGEATDSAVLIYETEP